MSTNTFANNPKNSSGGYDGLQNAANPRMVADTFATPGARWRKRHFPNECGRTAGTVEAPAGALTSRFARVAPPCEQAFQWANPDKHAEDDQDHRDGSVEQERPRPVGE